MCHLFSSGVVHFFVASYDSFTTPGLYLLGNFVVKCNSYIFSCYCHNAVPVLHLVDRLIPCKYKNTSFLKERIKQFFFFLSHVWVIQSNRDQSVWYLDTHYVNLDGTTEECSSKSEHILSVVVRIWIAKLRNLHVDSRCFSYLHSWQRQAAGKSSPFREFYMLVTGTQVTCRKSHGSQRDSNLLN